MTKRDIEVFYNQYKKSLTTIANLEKRSLKQCYSYEVWEANMKDRSKKFRALFQKNQKAYSNVIGELVDQPSILNEELADMFLTHVDFFISEGYRDYGVTIPVLQVLLPFYDSRHDFTKSLDCAYFMGVALMTEQCYPEACIYFSRAIAQGTLDDFEEPYLKYRLLCASYFRLQAYVSGATIEQSVLYSYYRKAIKDWTNPPEKLLSPKKSATIPSIIRTQTIFGVSRILDCHEGLTPELADVILEEWQYQQSLPANQRESCAIETIWYKYQKETGKISLQTYESGVRDHFRRCEQKFHDKFTYGDWDFIRLFDDELTDDIYSPDKLFYMNPSCPVISYLVPEMLKISNTKEERERVFQMVYRYFLEFPYIGTDGSIDIHLIYTLDICAQYCESDAFILECMQNIFVHRQTSTAIHSVMVGTLAAMITRSLAAKKPGIFTEFLGVSSADEIAMHIEELTSFAWKAGMCHDIGKIVCSDMINLQARKIVRDEFAFIQRHPVVGSLVLNRSKSLKEYADIAMGHHKTNDGIGGYPGEFDNLTSAKKIFIDIISICDSIDAATDTLGRNYSTAKSFKEVLKELQDMRGTRYSALVVDAMVEDEELLRELSLFLEKERSHVQYEVYRRFVEPDTKFLPADERFIRLGEERDLPKIIEVLGYESEWQTKVFTDSSFCFVVVDGHGNLYGTCMCEHLNQDILNIRQIAVHKDFRRNGYGTLLLEHVESVASDYGYRKILVPNEMDGHYDKFAWNNGYFLHENSKYLQKDIEA